MTSLKTSIILVWPGTNAAIPAGWEREDTLDGKYPKGTANETNPNTTGGNATHTHTVAVAHDHTISAHTHSTTVNNGSGGGVTTGAVQANSTAQREHAHAAVTSGAIGSASVSSVTPSYSAFSNNPSYHEVIFINPIANTNFVPDDVITLFDNATIPDGFVFCNGDGTTPDLRNKYLKGATGAGDAGGTGGTTTNAHDITHTHTTSHIQAVANVVATTTTAIAGKNEATFNVANTNHTHTATYTAATPSLDDNPSTTTTETVEPAYTKLIPIQNTSGDDIKVVKGLIGLFLGTLSNIPGGWILCDGTDGTVDMRGRYLKGTNLTSEADDTGGVNTHTHAASNHTHNAVVHTHTVTISAHTHGYKSYTVDDSGGVGANSSTTHAATTGSTNLVTDAGSTEAQSSNNEPEYRTVAFIKLNKIGNASSFLMNFM